ncbi:hypothetical protein [Arsukibacterium sp.]|uniref:hypothetical protein n=1 Tax=Arsukibacterium sp. TaxID=1977258 RepID=UPI001BD232E6|nr:hypothetical protein [Arsukibacterium sp.]
MKILRFYTIGFMLAFSVISRAATINGYVCEDCSLVQAEKIARLQGAPELNCQPACYSEPQKFIIFDVTNDMLYPFQLFHSNQGATKAKMNLQAEPAALTAVEAKVAQDFFALLVRQKQTLQQIALAEVKNVQLPALSFATSDACETDPAATVLNMTLVPTQKNSLQNSVNSKLSQQNTERYTKGFQHIRFTAGQFRAEKDGVILIVGGEYLKKSELISYYVFEPGQQIVPDGQYFFPARAAFTIGWDDSLNSVTVAVAKELTRVSADLSLADILDSSSWNISLSACAITELQNYYTASYAIPASLTSLDTNHGIPDSGSSDFPPPDLASSQQCKWVFYGENGQLLVNLTGPCPM